MTDERPDQQPRDDTLEMTAPATDDSSAAAGGPTADGTAGFRQPSPHAGQDSVLHGSVEHLDGRPFEGVPLTVTTDDGDPVALLHSDPEGRFSLPVRPGSYVVIASPSGCQPDARRVLVPDGALGESADFVLDGDGLLYGRVRGATTGVVTVLDAEGGVVAVADVADGEYEVAGLRSGTYTVTAVVPGSAPTASQVDVPSGDALEFDLGIGPADFSVARAPEPVPAGDPPRASGGPFGPGLHPVAMVRGGTGITGLPRTAPRPGTGPDPGDGSRPAPQDGFADDDGRAQDS